MSTQGQDAVRLYDKNGVPIEAGDIVRVFHFVGARRKRHYMYKQAMAYERRLCGGLRLKLSHLNRITDEPWEVGKNYYTEHVDGRLLLGYEVVQSMDAKFRARPLAPIIAELRKPALPTSNGGDQP